MDFIMTIVCIAYLVAGWRSLTYLQNVMGLSFFGSISRYVGAKLAFAIILGWLAIIITLLHKAFSGRKD